MVILGNLFYEAKWQTIGVLYDSELNILGFGLLMRRNLLKIKTNLERLTFFDSALLAHMCDRIL